MTVVLLEKAINYKRRFAKGKRHHFLTAIYYLSKNFNAFLVKSE